jgi:hypothetical protein
MYGLADDHKAARMAVCQAMLTRDEGMNGTFFSSIVTIFGFSQR